MKTSFRLLHTIASGGQTGATHPTGQPVIPGTGKGLSAGGPR